MKSAVACHKGTDILALGLGATVAMWAVGYVCRLPTVMAHGSVLLLAFVALLFGGGYVCARSSGRGMKGGATVGVLVWLLNLLILGSLLSGDDPNSLRPSALWWVPGSFLVCACVTGLGAAVGRGAYRADSEPPNWIGWFCAVGAAATFLLLLAGGLVTSYDAGLAVVDWPNSFGYNMFLYPLSLMTGGIYYEHAHRLLGSLVGLTTILLCIQLHRIDARQWLRRFSIAAVVMVIIQGILGGLRVTGRLTLTTDPLEVAPSLTLAVIHGVLGQCFFGVMVAMSVFNTRMWRSDQAPAARPSAGLDRGLGVATIVILVVQLVLGALQRHFTQGLLIHISLAVFVLVVGMTSAVRAWGLYPEIRDISRAGVMLICLFLVQVTLGFAALAVTGILEGRIEATPLEVTITTAHQAVGALLLALAVMQTMWCYRLVEPGREPPSL